MPEPQLVDEQQEPEHARALHAARAVVPPHREQTSGFGAVLRRRDFRYLWAAQAASQLADKFLIFTLIIVVYDLNKHSSTQSLLMIAYTLPSVFLSAPAGVYADRHDKRMLMLATNLVRAGLIVLIPLTQAEPHLRTHVWPLIVITLLFSAAGQIFAPAEAASIPTLVRRDQIMAATSLFMTTVILTLVLGVPIATLSLRFFGRDAPFYIAVGLFVIAAVCVWRVGTSLKAVRRGAIERPDIRRELRDGLAVLVGSPALRLALAQLTLALIVVFTVFALGPAYLETVLQRSSRDTYLVLIPATLGMVVTAIVLGQRPRVSRPLILVAALSAAGATLVVIGVGPTILHLSGRDDLLVLLTVSMSSVFGFALGGLLIPAFTVLQEGTTADTRGRIFGGIFTVINAAVALPLLLAGGLADAFGVDRVVGGLGTLLIVAAVLCRSMLWPHLRVLDEVDVA